MSTTPVKVAVTGAAGQIGYSLLFRLASGALGDRPIELEPEVGASLPANSDRELEILEEHEDPVTARDHGRRAGAHAEPAPRDVDEVGLRLVK